VTPSVVPIVWSIAGTDSGGGAGLSADQRAADAFGVHLCPVVAAVTAQHSTAVTRIDVMPVEVLDAQLRTLADDMPPHVIKTGLLGGAEQVHCVARWVDRLRERAPVALVVDPVLAASSGASFADDATLQAYRDELLPRATVVTPNWREAERLAGLGAGESTPPTLARALRQRGAEAVCVTGGDAADVAGRVLDWFDSDLAQGWLASDRVATRHHHGTGCTFATSVAAALALGFVAPDAVVLAKMAVTHALRHGHAAGAGAGPVHAQPGFGNDASLLPMWSWGEAPRFQAPQAFARRRLDLYAIVDSADMLLRALYAGVRTLQLRIKTPDAPDARWWDALRDDIRRSIAACDRADAELFINDHWRLALELGARGVHLGQEDLLALGDTGRAALAASGLALGISSHSLWELCRARASAPRYIACGPVWPTLTKAMPWRPQGLHNLRWWRAMAGTPVVAIGGVLRAEQVHAAAACGVDGVCVVRALGNEPTLSVPPLQRALQAGRAQAGAGQVPAWPHPTLAAVSTRGLDGAASAPGEPGAQHGDADGAQPRGDVVQQAGVGVYPA
jgi:hydroxymethylpyrimidine kinase/phosphomethylpyrimidine kinase/thiamine-phosphate diphosphorylase